MDAYNEVYPYSSLGYLSPNDFSEPSFSLPRVRFSVLQADQLLWRQSPSIPRQEPAPTSQNYFHNIDRGLINHMPAQRYHRSLHGWHFIWLLLSISFLLHVFMSKGMGAKYWWDTIAYFQLAESLQDLNSLRALYAGPFGIIYQHLMPGLPVLILACEKLFGSAMWPAFAIFQNGLDIIGCVYLATAFSRRISRSGQLAIVLLTAVFPYFSAFHNAILTESLTSSLVMIMVGATIRCLERRLTLTSGLIVTLGLGVIGGEIRSYILLIGAGLSVLVIFSNTGFQHLRLYILVAITTAIGASIFPIYRTAAGIEFFYPRVDALMLAHANYVNWDLDERSKHAVERTVFDPAILYKLETAGHTLDPDDIVKMVDDLVNQGLSRSEAIRQISGAAWVVRTQSWEVIERQLQLSLSSLGFQSISTCCDPDRFLRNGGFTGEKMLAHLQYYYLWNAGVDRSDYLKLFDEFALQYQAAPKYYSQSAIDWYTSRVRPFVRNTPYPLRDFAGLSAISPDVLVVLGLLGFIVIGRQDWRLAIVIALLIVPVYVASLSAAFVGDNRHAHLLWPFYTLGIVALLDQLIIQFRAQYDRTKTSVSAPPPAD